MRNEIIQYIKRNRVSTTEVADCLDKSGSIEHIFPINRGQFKAGKIKYTYAIEESNWFVHEQIVDTDENDIVFVDSINCKGRATIGELICKYILLYRQASAIITNSPVRDAGALIKENYSIWCDGFNPVGCFNIKPSKELPNQIIEEHKAMYDGAIAVCDDCGVVIIPKEFHTEEFLQKLHHIEDQEDIWFDRLDHYKENTFEIVCLKNYLKEQK